MLPFTNGLGLGRLGIAQTDIPEGFDSPELVDVVACTWPDDATNRPKRGTAEVAVVAPFNSNNVYKAELETDAAPVGKDASVDGNDPLLLWRGGEA